MVILYSHAQVNIIVCINWIHYKPKLHNTILYYFLLEGTTTGKF